MMSMYYVLVLVLVLVLEVYSIYILYLLVLEVVYSIQIQTLSILLIICIRFKARTQSRRNWRGIFESMRNFKGKRLKVLDANDLNSSKSSTSKSIFESKNEIFSNEETLLWRTRKTLFYLLYSGSSVSKTFRHLPLKFLMLSNIPQFLLLLSARFEPDTNDK